MRRRPLRRIVSVEYYQTSSHPNGTYSVDCLLECGHHARLKASVFERNGQKKRTLCSECEMKESEE